MGLRTRCTVNDPDSKALQLSRTELVELKALQHWLVGGSCAMAPPRGLSTPRALKVSIKKEKGKTVWSRSMRLSYGFVPYFACAKL